MPHEVKVRGFTELSEGLQLDFVQSVPDELTCSSCQDLVGILWLSPSCEHRFCTRCLESLLGQASKSICPVDQAEISRGQLVEDTSVQSKASQFQAWCPNRGQGCTVTPRICDLKNHLRECNQVVMASIPPGTSANSNSSANNDANSSAGSGESDGTPRCWMAEFGCDFQGSAAEVEAHENDWQLHRQMVVTRLSEYRRNLEMSMAPTEASMASMAHPGMSGSNDEVITRPDGQFRWLLKEYSRTKRHQRHGTHRYTSSPIFCTGVPGYRLQLRLHLNGMGQSRKGRFMAVQLVLLRGPNDSELAWPFRHRASVMVTLVNQNGPQHVSYTINDPSFPRPQGEHTVPYVWQEFVAFSDLEANPGLAWNDCLLFEVTVTPPSPPPPGMYPPL
ncbi:hypothetical protein HPB52_002029 [Rhipicephalus sanguineus]|uniref:Uncharacterized protein n=1 Tax=Rhipicephalus sanguineus TaxID=34632 RepID=A0A9D4PGP4_RHISA|nr:hypothetical protein HPB52_002029 [Rhipicephalus sanguineus]